ncbi:hypothetical protein COCMIDRAFT_92272 [Bipolaris oryzae ATCC 44560]|uniref:Uncharacterized protein n=1 Tax=Bipolaris oryzae ATCC 44560 TaxID=930090 RepID=W6ZGK1_COCMI|nr:uncharacterized protein COCMIDRAFT_92272 [Bipolaris oryzae ATCC 44560]EUC46634.1 hypothetical protein COCMIDRAFT_92272 [Bipolaris oryzae ATCC 44560]
MVEVANFYCSWCNCRVGVQRCFRGYFRVLVHPLLWHEPQLMKVSYAWYVSDVPPSGMQVAASELLERQLRFDLLP